MCRVAARAFIPPLCGGEGWTIRPRRGARHGCRALFVRAGARSKSPAAPHGLAGRSPDSATRGAVLFGYFLLGKQEKVTRAAAAVRKPAVPRGLPSVAGEPDRECMATNPPQRACAIRRTMQTGAKGCRAQGALPQRRLRRLGGKTRRPSPNPLPAQTREQSYLKRNARAPRPAAAPAAPSPNGRPAGTRTAPSGTRWNS